MSRILILQNSKGLKALLRTLPASPSGGHKFLNLGDMRQGHRELLKQYGLRFEYLFQISVCPRSGSGRILVALEGIFEAYRLVNYAFRELKSSPYQVKVRTHPMLPFSRFAYKLGTKLTVTAIMMLDQVRDVAACLDSAVPSYISVFAGRVADTGRDPFRYMAEAVGLLKRSRCFTMMRCRLVMISE